MVIAVVVKGSYIDKGVLACCDASCQRPEYGMN